MKELNVSQTMYFGNSDSDNAFNPGVIDAYIIDKIKKDQFERENYDRTGLRIPVPEVPYWPENKPREEDEYKDRGVTIIQMHAGDNIEYRL
jgi:hypothetical protein